jgi:hypothetical protein
MILNRHRVLALLVSIFLAPPYVMGSDEDAEPAPHAGARARSVDPVEKLPARERDISRRAHTRTRGVLSRVDPADRAAFFNLAQRLFTPDMNISRRTNIRDVLSRVDPADRETFVRQVQRLFTSDMNGDERARVIGALAEVSAPRRARQVERVLAHAGLAPHDPGYVQRVLQIFETPLAQPIPPLQRGIIEEVVADAHA